MNYPWYKRMTRKEFHPTNEQSSSEKNETDTESIIEELKGKLSKLKFRLLDCQDQNQMLRKELLLAKKVVATEVSPDMEGNNFHDLLHQSNSTDYKGRREKILLLKDKLEELQNRIKEIEEGKSVKSSEDGVKADKGDTLKDHYYREKQVKSKELSYFLDNACQLKRKLEVWKKRNAELSKEAEVLRLELDRLLEKSKEDREIHQSYSTLEKELRARQSEKIEMRNKLVLEKSRNKQLVDEIAFVKEDISAMMSKINDDKVLVDALNNQQGYLRDLLERQQLISENDHRRFQDDLSEIETKHVSNCGVLIRVKDAVDEKAILCRQLQNNIQKMDLIGYGKDEEEQISTSTITAESQQSELSEPQQQQPAPTADSSETAQEEPSEAEKEKNKLIDERDEYVNIYRSIADEIGQVRKILHANGDRINEWMSQLFDSRSLLAKRNAEVRSCQETLKKLKEPWPKSAKTSSQESSLFTDEIQKKSDVFKEEYRFLVRVWDLLLTNKDNSTFVFTLSLDSVARVFVDTLNDLTLPESNLDQEEPEEEYEQSSEVSTQNED